MHRPHALYLIPTTESLTVTVKLSLGGAVRSETYRYPLRDLRSSDLEAMVVALGAEADRRVRARWAELQDQLPYD
jgi:hypothetical protein